MSALVPFAIEADAVSMDWLNPRQRRSLVSRIIEIWEKVGILVLPAEQATSGEPPVWVSTLPPDMRDRWVTAFKVLHLTPGPPGWTGISSDQQLEQLATLRGSVEVALLEETLAVEFGVNEDEGALHHQDLDLELVCIDSVENSRRFKDALDLSVTSVGPEDDAEQLWNSRFKQLAGISRHCVVVDRYAIVDHLRAALRSSKPPQQTGLENFLRWTDACARKMSITLIAGLQHDETPATMREAVREIAQKCRRGGLRHLRLVLVDGFAFGKISHKRHIRFDRHVCCVDHGLKLLSDRGDRSRFSDMQLVVRQKTHEQVEHELELQGRDTRAWHVNNGVLRRDRGQDMDQ